MSSGKRINVCLTVIVVLALTEGSLLLAAGMGNDVLVDQLRSDIDLILGATGVIVTALVTTIGILWRSLRSSQREFIETLKRLKDDS